MQKLLLSLVQFYRKRISPMKRPTCRFIPTCSQYALEALEKYGARKGLILTVKRLLRCQPFYRCDSFYDPVP